MLIIHHYKIRTCILSHIYILPSPPEKMTKPKKQKIKEERKEIKIIRVIQENNLKEIKPEKKLRMERGQAFEELRAPRGDFDEFMEGERTVSLLKSDQIQNTQNLEKELALIPSPATTAGEENNTLNYSPSKGYGKSGYGDHSYETNNQYNTGRAETMRTTPSLDQERTFVPLHDQERERAQQSTRSQQERVMDYTTNIQPEEKKKKRFEG